MTRTGIFALAAAAGLGLALASAGIAVSAGNPAVERQEIMKQVGLQMKDGAGFAVGQTPWDTAKVKTLMGGLASNSKKLHGLYPTGSGGDPKSAADPKIWTNKADFLKRLTEMQTLATTASNAKTVDAYKPVFGQLSGTCKGCHDIYRKKKA